MTTKGDPLFIEHVERLSMSDCESTPAEVRDRLRSIPAAHELLAEWPVMKAAGDAGDMIVRETIDAELDAEREAIRSGTPARNKRELALAIEQRCHRLSLPTLRPAVNATGVVIHTNLGRAPLAPAAVQAVTDVARGYSTLEYDVATCARGGRKEHAARLLRTLREAQCEEAVELQVVEGVSTPGGGSLPTVELPTFCVAVCPVDGRLSADGLKRALVQEPDTPVVTRVRHDQVLFDVRTLLRDTDLDLDVEAFLDGTVFAGASIVPVSSKTGEGLDGPLTALDNAVCSCWSEHLEAAVGSGAAPRLPIDRCFSIRGTGTVVTGTLHDGPVSVGDELVALPSQTRCRVRGGRFTGMPSARFPASASP